MTAEGTGIDPVTRCKTLKYDYEFDIEGDSAAARIIRMVRPGGSVLDIGAGPGAITRELKRRSNCRITALDIDPHNVERLAQFCDATHKVDLNDPDWPKVLGSDRKFDTVLATDVLEHLWDPWKTISLMCSLIKDDGEIIISLPHVGHCVVAACLINENFDYRDDGLLDRTHIRFFGLKNMQSLINDAGLNIVDAQFVVRAPESTELFDQWSRLSRDAQQFLSSRKYANVYQAVIKARNKLRVDKNVDLESIDLEEPNISATVRIMPSLHFRMRQQARSLLSVESRRRLRRLALRLGIRY
jgi:2-polyprenyl-3-methyl-5-hydroxy-6-metoxy-1,4-benzoquinol methylase